MRASATTVAPWWKPSSTRSDGHRSARILAVGDLRRPFDFGASQPSLDARHLVIGHIRQAVGDAHELRKVGPVVVSKRLELARDHGGGILRVDRALPKRHRRNPLLGTRHIRRALIGRAKPRRPAIGEVEAEPGDRILVMIEEEVPDIRSGFVGGLAVFVDRSESAEERDVDAGSAGENLAPPPTRVRRPRPQRSAHSKVGEDCRSAARERTLTCLRPEALTVEHDLRTVRRVTLIEFIVDRVKESTVLLDRQRNLRG